MCFEFREMITAIQLSSLRSSRTMKYEFTSRRQTNSCHSGTSAVIKTKEGVAGLECNEKHAHSLFFCYRLQGHPSQRNCSSWQPELSRNLCRLLHHHHHKDAPVHTSLKSTQFYSPDLATYDCLVLQNETEVGGALLRHCRWNPNGIARSTEQPSVEGFPRCFLRRRRTARVYIPA